MSEVCINCCLQARLCFNNPLLNCKKYPMLINALRVNIEGHQCCLMTRWTHKYLHCYEYSFAIPLFVYYQPPMKLQKGNVFSPVCPSFCPWPRVSLPMTCDLTALPHWAGTPSPLLVTSALSAVIWWLLKCIQSAQAGNMHPTWMLSYVCYMYFV